MQANLALEHQVAVVSGTEPMVSFGSLTCEAIVPQGDVGHTRPDAFHAPYHGQRSTKVVVPEVQRLHAAHAAPGGR